MSANEIACTARLLCKAAAKHFNAPEHTSVRLSRPVSPHAFDQRWGSAAAMRYLSLKQRKLLLLLTAGCGGSARNVAVALGAVGMTGFKELDLYEAAAKAGSLRTCRLLWQQECDLPRMEQRDKAGMLAAASAGQLEICIWLHNEHHVPWTFERHSVMDVLATAGHVTACRRLHEQEDVPYTEAVLAAAAGNGDPALCRSLQAAGCPGGKAAFKAAAARGHKAVCDWLLESGSVTHLDATVAAVEAGHSELLNQLLDDLLVSGGDRGDGHPASAEMLWHRVLPAAAAGCDLVTLQALFQRAAAAAATPGAPDAAAAARGQGSPVHHRLPASVRSKALVAAANSSAADWREKTTWLMEAQGCQLTDDRVRVDVAHSNGGGDDAGGGACGAAALDRLLWLSEAGLRTEKPLDMEMLALFFRVAAAGAEALPTLGRFLDAHAVTSSRYAASTLAERGHWRALLLLHARGRPIGKDLVAEVARWGEVAALEALLAALGGAVVLTPEATRGAAESGRVKMLEWLRGRGCRLETRDAGVFAAAAKGGSEEMLEWLRGRGFSMGADGAPYLAAATNGDLRTLRCLRRLGCRWTKDTLATACRRAPLPVLRWMVEEGFPVQLAQAREGATLRRSPEVTKWLAGLQQTQ